MTDKNALWARVVNIICGDKSPSYNHGAKADLIFMVVEKPLRARIAELEAALKPFEEELRNQELEVPQVIDGESLIHSYGLRLRDLRAARAALKGENG